MKKIIYLTIGIIIIPILLTSCEKRTLEIKFIVTVTESDSTGKSVLVEGANVIMGRKDDGTNNLANGYTSDEGIYEFTEKVDVNRYHYVTCFGYPRKVGQVITHSFSFIL